MGIFETASSYIKNIFNKKNNIVLGNCINLIMDNCYKEYALQKTINLISSTLCSAKFKTYLDKKEVNKDLSYYLNISPNRNHNAYDFYYQIIYKLIKKQEALVIQINDEFYVADSFEKEKYAFYDWIFYDIVVDEFQLDKKFKMSDVLYFTFANNQLSKITESINANYSEILSYSKNSYIQDKLRKIIVNFESTNNLNEEDEEDGGLQNLVNDIIKPFLEGKRNVLTLPKGFNLEKFETKSTGTSITEIIDNGKQIIENIANLFNIPIDVFYGNKAEIAEQYNMYISNGFKPFKTIFETELNRKLYTRKQYIDGNYIKLDISHLKYKDIFEIADGADKLARIGFTHNFIREKLGEEKSDKSFAENSYVTKNNECVDNKKEVS